MVGRQMTFWGFYRRAYLLDFDGIESYLTNLVG